MYRKSSKSQMITGLTFVSLPTLGILFANASSIIDHTFLSENVIIYYIAAIVAFGLLIISRILYTNVKYNCEFHCDNDKSPNADVEEFLPFWRRLLSFRKW